MTDTTAAPAAPAAPAPAAPSAPATRTDPASFFPPGAAPPLHSAEYVRAAKAGALVDFGHMTAEQARAELARSPGDTSKPAIDSPAHNAAQPDGQQAPAVNEPDSYTPGEAMVKALEVSGALQHESIGLQKGEAKFYSDALSSALANPPSREQRTQTAANTVAALQRLYPDGKAEKILADARAELKAMTATMPNLPHLLEVSGGGDDLHLILRMAERAAKRAKENLARGLRR